MAHDTLTPPAAATPPPPATPSSAPRVISTLLIVLGAIVVVWTLVSGAITALDATLRQDQTRDLPVTGVTELDVDVSRIDLDIVFAAVDRATLEVTDSGRGEWTFERDGGRLRVSSPRDRWFGWLLFGRGGHATLTLPESLSGLDAKLSLSAGSLDAAGSFGDLTLELAAGALSVSGDARALDATVSAGSANLTLADVGQTKLSLAAGELVGRLTGTPPGRTSVDVSAGSLELTLPDVAYAVRSDVSAGSLDDSRLRTSSTSSNAVSVQVSAGSVVLRGRD